ncbi:MAG: serine/threonine-protein kinase [Vicinamibacterales bacterium]
MASERFDQLKTLFNQALDLAPERRDAWLRDATTDADLRRELERLLLAHDTAGTFLESPPPMALPERIGPYDIERELGRGGMGIVYLAHDSRLNRRVALKALPPLAPGDTARRDRLRREARAAARLSHPGIAAVYALEEFEGDLYLASAFAGERTLRDVLRGGPLAPQRAVRIAGQIARALEAAHAAGIVHRDLKPENIVLADEGDDRITLVDFGIAQAAGAADPGPLSGTPGYLAPEQLAGAAADGRSDIYALGVILGEMLLGHHPLARDEGAIPEPLRAIVSRCLASEPRARYQTTAAFLAALDGDRAAGGRAYAWWAFHQGAAVAIYALMLIPLWSARGLIGGAPGRMIFLTALAACVVSSALRLHRWFASRWYVEDFPRVRRRSTTPLLVGDAAFAAATLASGLALDAAAEPLAILLVSVSAGTAVSFLLIEPATTRAAFRVARIMD